ncbi:M23 family metallopeptidase [Erythrobacter sp. SCSIO 43205]|uniref:M23 family metallopeptidase n=1 Tax=Erythrobacter sp. SCSIO 43205 TaxID=2779361 RepID=UPI001CA9B710|nr:M23 family metallopeptidase [Erythrobacter sp. SCSIO 43205]UAB78573.1 M23 family metallopeptidase [Erythrobacter sp. SCSIO 43205]
MYASLRSISKTVTAIFGAATLFVAPSAHANSSANSAADVTAPIRETQAETLANGDERFRELFASWTSLDSLSSTIDTPPVVVERPTVSVPSLTPVNGARMSSGFGHRTHPTRGGRRMHKGVDLAAPTGTPVYATADGIVDLARWGRGYGLYIKVDHGAELETRYAHLSRLAVAAGDRVEKGEVIGYVGSTGWSTGPHLHYEVRVNGVAVDPIHYMVAEREEVDAPQDRIAMIEGRRRVGAGGE